jgi:hypothetical protein
VGGEVVIDAERQVLTVTEGALVARINTVLAERGQRLRTARGMYSAWYPGRYYIEEEAADGYAATHVDIEVLGRELGVLADDERIQFKTRARPRLRVVR